MKFIKVYDTEADKITGQSSLYPPSIIKVRDPLNVYYTAGNYIKNGLIFQLDGIHKGTTANAWTDLIGGIVFANNGATEGENYWEFTNSTSTYNSLRNTGSLPFGANSWNTHTIEAVYESTLTRAQVILIPKTNSTLCIGFSGINTYRFLIATSSSECQIDAANNTSIRGFHTASVNYNGGLMDGSVSLNRITGSNYFQASSNYNGIGADSATANYSFQGKIYAIRVYNRLLTTAEMMHNQKEDIKRFNLGV